MKRAENAIDTYINGNRADFKAWLKKASKLEILHAIEYYSGNYGQRHQIISTMINYLEDK